MPVYYDPYDYGDRRRPARRYGSGYATKSRVYCNEQYDFYALSRYDDVLRGALETDTFSSAHGTRSR